MARGQVGPDRGQLVAAPRQGGRQRLLADLQRPQARGLRGHRPPRALHRVDHLDVLVAHPLQEREALEEVGEAPRLQDDRDRVGSPGLVGGADLLGQDRHVALHALLQERQPPTSRLQRRARGGQLGLLGGHVGLHRRQPALGGCQAGAQLRRPSAGRLRGAA